MRIILSIVLGLSIFLADFAAAGESGEVLSYQQLKTVFPSLTVEQYVYFADILSQCTSANPNYLGRLSANPYDPESTSNEYGLYGSSYSSESIHNSYGVYGSPYSSQSWTNPYATDTPRLFGADGQYLGKLSSNRYDPESISNPYGIYGSPYSPYSINNPYSPYGSEYSPLSANNPYATDAPCIIDTDDWDSWE